MCEALPIAMPGFLERLPTTTAKDTSDETKRLTKTTVISYSTLEIEVQEF